MEHGGDIYSQHIEVDFSANINPFGMPERVAEAACRAVRQSAAYPDPQCRALIREIAAYENLREDQVICGNGAADLIFSLTAALKPRRALIPVPSFAEYEKALHAVGASCDYYYMKEADGFELTAGFLNILDRAGWDLVFLCNPNNPTGCLTNREFLLQILEICQRRGIVCVLDECFLDFAQQREALTMKPYLEEFPVLFILKAFTKMYGMAGLRLGYGLTANLEYLERIRAVRQFWNVSTPAQQAGIAALQEEAFREQTRVYVAKENQWMRSQLIRLGFLVYGSQVNYLFFRWEAPENELYHRLLEQQVLIRSCQSYRGLDGTFYRVAVRTAKENKKLIGLLEQIIEGSGRWQKQL